MIGSNQKLIPGKVYLNYVDNTDSLTLTNIFPETKEEARSRTDNVIEFTVEGINTSDKKSVYYEIILNYGNEITDKTRFKDEDMVFDLVEVDEDGNETMVVDALRYDEFNARRIWVNTVDSGSTINKKYKLRMWLSENVVISDSVDYADYSTSVFKNSYASVKVSVYGDMESKYK